MKAEQFREALDALELTQNAAAQLLGVNPRTARRWALGELEIPQAIALVLGLMRRHKVTPAQAAALIGAEAPRKPYVRAVKIPTVTMEQEFAAHYRRGYAAGVKDKGPA